MGVCTFTKPMYAPNRKGGCEIAASKGDGYSIHIIWDQAAESVYGYELGYNVYYSTIREDVFTEGVKLVSIDDPSDDTFDGYVLDLTPGDVYYFAVKATQHDPAVFNFALLPNGFPGFKIYPEGLLLANIDELDMIIQISDIGQFPAFGVVQVGTEWIRYISKDIPSSSLIVAERGFLGTNVRIHNTDGYDGVETRDPIVKFWAGEEDDNLRVQQATASFSYPNIPFTRADGYAVKQDLITTNLGASDADMSDFPRYDFVGWHRTDPVRLLRGECIGTYYGGENFCADGYLGINRQLRGMSINEQAARREEVLLDAWGEPCVLVRRLWEGIRCSCVMQTNEQAEYRCVFCFGTGIIGGYQQFFNPRKSDGRIRVRFDPTQEDFKMENAGLENVFLPNCWTIVYPSIKDRDFLIRFDENGVEEFRYEILNVTRNILSEGKSGAQKFVAQRVRRTDPIYQWHSFRNTAARPETISTSIGLLAGPNGTSIPHMHTVVINENIMAVSQINQTTSMSNGHTHQVISGIIQEAVGHQHSIIL
jgi:hypothetical protein